MRAAEHIHGAGFAGAGFALIGVALVDVNVRQLDVDRAYASVSTQRLNSLVGTLVQEPRTMFVSDSMSTD